MPFTLAGYWQAPCQRGVCSETECGATFLVPADLQRRLLRPNLAQQLLAQSAVPVLAVPPWRPPLPAGAPGYGSAPA